MRRSALYEGTVMHQRTGAHAGGFVRRVAMPLLDLDEVEGLTDLALLWRAERAAPVTFRRADFMGNPDVPLRDTVLDLVERRAGFRPNGPVRLLAHHRSWGWCFNPIALYYCYDAGEALEAVVADVTNTPWGESHAYVLDAREGVREVDNEAKALQRITLSAHGSQLSVPLHGAGDAVWARDHCHACRVGGLPGGVVVAPPATDARRGRGDAGAIPADDTPCVRRDLRARRATLAPSRTLRRTPQGGGMSDATARSIAAPRATAGLHAVSRSRCWDASSMER